MLSFKFVILLCVTSGIGSHILMLTKHMSFLRLPIGHSYTPEPASLTVSPVGSLVFSLIVSFTSTLNIGMNYANL